MNGFRDIYGKEGPNCARPVPSPSDAFEAPLYTLRDCFSQSTYVPPPPQDETGYQGWDSTDAPFDPWGEAAEDVYGDADRAGEQGVPNSGSSGDQPTVARDDPYDPWDDTPLPQENIPMEGVPNSSTSGAPAGQTHGAYGGGATLGRAGRFTGRVPETPQDHWPGADLAKKDTCHSLLMSNPMRHHRRQTLLRTRRRLRLG